MLAGTSFGTRECSPNPPASHLTNSHVSVIVPSAKTFRLSPGRLCPLPGATFQRGGSPIEKQCPYCDGEMKAFVQAHKPDAATIFWTCEDCRFQQHIVDSTEHEDDGSGSWFRFEIPNGEIPTGDSFTVHGALHLRIEEDEE